MISTQVAAELDTYGHAGTRRRVVGTVHLESLDTERTRAAQLRQISAVEGLDLLCGDFNFDDVSTWGEWRQPGRKRPVSALENNVLAVWKSTNWCVGFFQAVRNRHRHAAGKRRVDGVF